MPHRLSKNINNIKQTLKKTYSSELGRWIMSVFVSFFILGILFLFFRPVFMTIDDPRVRYVYAGYATGEPVGNYLFCNVIFGSAVAGLYRLIPGVPWYVIYHLVLIGLSSSAIGKTIYKLCYKKNIKLCGAVSIHIATYLTLCVISTIMMHFEITAVMTGAAAIALLLGINDEDKKAAQFIDMIFSSFLLFVTFLISKNNVYAICCYMAVVFAYHLLHMISAHNKKIFIRLIAFFLPLTAAGIVSAFYCNNMAKSSDEWQEYLSYNKYRVSYWDYPHDTYKDNPELFESIGWSEEFYNLAEEMYFIDERFNKDALSSFVEPFSWFNSLSKEEIIENATTSVLSLYKNEHIIKLHILLSIIMLLTLASLFYKDKYKKKNAPIYLTLLFNYAGTFILISFLAIRARLPLRAWMSCFIPFGIINIIQLLRLYCVEKPESNKDDAKYAKKRLGYSLLIAICCFVFLNTFKRGIIYGYNYRVDMVDRVTAVENYCIEHKENIYVYEPHFIQNYSAMTEYKNIDDAPLNMLTWGTSYIYTPAFYQQMKNMGYESFYTYNLIDENVYFIGNADNLEDSELFLYLEKEYPDFDYEIVDEIERCAVIKFYKN